MDEKVWIRKADFINMILFAAITHGDIKIEDTVFDGVAGNQFNAAIEACSGADRGFRNNYYINLAIKLEAPVEGLVADGEFGEKWQEVVALCKQK